MRSRVAALVMLGLLMSASSCRKGDSHEASADGPASDAGDVTPAMAPSHERAPIASRAMETWVYERPDATSPKLGYLRAGDTVLSRGKLVGGTRGSTCPQGWVPIEPRGFVCLGSTATANLDDAIVKASTRRPELTAGLPYGYAVVRNQGAPFYTRLPSMSEARALEPDWDYHFRTLEGAEADESREGGYAQLSSVPGGRFPLEPSPGVLASWASDGRDDPLPPFLAGGGRVPNLSGLAWSQRTEYDGGTTCSPGDRDCVPLDAARPRKRLGISFVGSFAHDGRRWLLTTDLLLMPADRVRIVRGTSFHGITLEGEPGTPSRRTTPDGPPAGSAPAGSADGPGPGAGAHRLPLVFVRKPGAHRYDFDGRVMTATEELPWRTALNAARKQRVVGGVRYHELEDGSYVADGDVVRLDPIRKMPKWGKDGERWIEINLAKQTLLAVDGTRPVYATLVSTGAGGLASPKENPYVTPRGIFRIHTKHVAATMDSNQPEAEFELRDVPWIQYFQDGFALHAAYWHDQFGQPRSHGCVNLAPIDAQWLFAFTKPELPTGWHGVMQALTGTIVWIHA